MGLQVLLVGRLRPELGVAGAHEGVPVADVRSPEAVQDSVARLTGPDGSLVVLCSPEDEAEVRRQLNLLSVALPRVGLLLETFPGTPHALAVVAALVGDPDGSRDPAAQLALLDRLRAEVWSAVWLPSVARLDEPRPSLGQHVRGWLGGPGFLAVRTPRPSVKPCTGTTVPPADDAPASGVLLVADSGAPDWVVPSAARAWNVEPRTDFTTWRDPRDAYGVTACVEFLVVPGDLDAARDSAAGACECPACGNRHARRVCPWCRMATTETPDPQGADA